MADKSQGTILSWGGTAVAEITGFNGPGFSHPTIDVSNLASTARAKIAAGLVDCGQVKLDVNFDGGTASNQHDLIIDDCIAGNRREMIITFLNGTSASSLYTFNAFATEVSPTAALGEKLTASMTFDIDGTVAIT